MAFTSTSDFTPEIISSIEEKIGYRFSDKDTLMQAFIRSSYSQECNNEAFEFFGDSALGLVIVKKMSKVYAYRENEIEWIKKFLVVDSESNSHYFDYTEGEMTEIKKSLVSTGALSRAIDALGFEKYLIMSAGDVKEGVENQPHVKEDLFEAIVGAVAIDSEWGIEQLTGVIDIMLNPDIVIKRGGYIDKKYELEAAAMVETPPIYQVYTCERGYRVSVRLDCYGKKFHPSCYDSEIYRDEDSEIVFPEPVEIFGFGKSEESARGAAAKKFIEFIKAQREILKNLDCKKPGEYVSMLNELSQKNIISAPIYDIVNTGEKTKVGNPIWECTLTVGFNEHSTKAENKQAAKNNAAMRMIYKLLNFDDFMPTYSDLEQEKRNSDFETLIKKLSKEIKI